MATVPRPAERYVEFDEYIDFQLDKARSGIKWTDILAAGAGVAALILGYLVAFVAADHWLFAGGVPTSLRYASLAVVILAAVVWLAVRVVWPYVRQVNDLYAARMLEDAEPGLRGSLFGLVDLRRAGREPAEEVRRALEKRAATVLSDVDVESSLDRRPLLRTSYALLAVVLIACIYAVATPKRVGPSLVRALFPTSATGVATRTEIIEVKPGSVTVLAGSQLDVSVTIRGETPERVMLYYSTADRRFADEPIEMRLHDETTREYQAVLIGDAGRGLTQDLTYRIEANDDAAGPFTVEVDQPPVATITSVTLQPPAYTALEPVVRDTPQIDAVEGSAVSIAATANRKLKSAKLVFADDERFLARGEEVPMRVAADGVTLTANWKLVIRSDGTSPTFYRIECRDIADKSNPNPAVFPIAIRPDLPPEVTLFDPKSDLERPANAVIPLVVSARDPDFGLRELTLRLERQGQELPERTVLWEGTQSKVAVEHDWDLAPLGLKPGDVVSFYVQARDNREPEFNRRNSPKLNVTITEPVSQEEVEQQLADDRKRQEQERAEAEQNANGSEGETPPDGADTEPMTAGEPNESDGEPGESQENENPGEPGENPSEGTPSESTQGEDGQQAGSPVNNDGTNDDVALRELVEHQRKQQEQQRQPQAEQPPSESTDEGQGSESEKGGASQNAGQKQTGDQQKSSEGDPSRKSEGNKNGGTGDEQKAGHDQQGTERREGGNAADRSRNNGQPSDNSGNAGTDTPREKPPAGEARDGGPNDTQKGAAGKPQGESTGEPGEGMESGEEPTGASPEKSSQEPGKSGTERTPNDRGQSALKTSNDETGNESPSSETGEDGGKSSRPAAGASEREPQSMDRQGAPNGDRPTDVKPQPGETTPGEPASEGGEPQTGEPRSADPRSNDQPSGPPQPQPGPGRDGQRSQRPESGENGMGEPNAAGSPSQQPGQSDTSTQPGGTQPGKSGTQPRESQGGQPTATPQGEKTPGNQKPPEGQQPSGMGEAGEGQSGEGQSSEGQSSEGQSGKGQSGEGQSGEGQSGKGQSGEGQSGEGQSGEGQSGEGQSGEGQSGEGRSGEGQSGEGQSGKGSMGQGGASRGSSSQPGGGGAPGSQGDGGGNAAGAAGAEQANAAYTKQATDLALKKLEDELQRGEVDPDLLKELGWTEEDMRRFADRLRKNLSEPTGDETPQQLAERKEFEHMLENLQLDAGPAARNATTGRVKEVGDVGTANPRVPSEYRDAYEAFTRSVAGRRQASEKKK